MMTWVIAVETGANSGRVHAYDLEKGQVPHPLHRGCEVHTDRRWPDPAPGRRCQHCLEIVGLYCPSDG
jgi:hypothetical protein